jgi:hypothetical protein
MKYNKLNRRMFLQGSGTMLAIPFLQSLLPREAWAQTAPLAKRFVSILSLFDYGHHSNWFPNTSGNIADLVQPTRVLPAANGDAPVHWQPLRDFAPSGTSGLSLILGPWMGPYMEQLNLLRGLDFIARAGHDASQALGGMYTVSNADLGDLRITPTIDHLLNINKKVNPAGLPIVVCGSSGGAGNYWSLAPLNGGAIPATNMGGDLGGIFNKLFANGSHPQAGDPNYKNPKSDMLSRVLGDYTRVRNSRNISSADKVVLDNALDKISDVQKSLTRIATASCHYKQITPSGSIGDVAGSAIVGKALADIISAAIMCDTARVFTVGADILSGNYDGEEFDHQTTSHRPFDIANGKPQWQRMGERHALVTKNFLAPLLQNLAGATDPSNGKSFLYNSLVLKSGETSQVHGWGSHPALLAGNAGGALSSGNYVDYSDRSKGPLDGCDGGTGLFNITPGDPLFSNNYYGMTYNRLLVTILQAMGLTPADYERDADNSQLYNRTDIGAQNANMTSLGGYGHAFRVDLSRGGWAAVTYAKALPFYNLKTFRYKLPLP